jgi:hypothetical protein
MPATTRRTGTRRPSPKVTVSDIVSWFREYLAFNEASKSDGKEATIRKDRLKEELPKLGEKDEKGNFWFDLPDAVEHITVDNKGNTKVLQYTTLKAERRLSPSTPTPDPEKAEDVLRAKGLWLTKAQEKAIRDLQTAVPNATISVEVDVNAFASLYYKDVLSEEEYEDTLVEQTETYAFIPSES